MTLSRKRRQQPQFSWKKASKSFLLVFLLAVLAYVALLFNKEEHFPIQRVKVFGVVRVQQNELRHLLSPLVQKGFFAVDVENIKDRLLQLSWVADVSVRRIW